MVSISSMVTFIYFQGICNSALFFTFCTQPGRNNSPGAFLIFSEQTQSSACAQSSRLPEMNGISARPLASLLLDLPVKVLAGLPL